MADAPHQNDKPLSGKTFALAAGGTGGHVFPAESLAHALIALGAEVALLTDVRGEAFTKRFPGRVVVVPSAPWQTSPQALLKLSMSLFEGALTCFTRYRRLKPACVIGFGGYPTVTPLLVARAMGIPTIIHEQNAVLGRANRLIAPFAKAIALGLPVDLFEKPEWQKKAHLTGTPVRNAVMNCIHKPYPKRKATEPMNIVVFGGSQGARVFADVLPPACGMLTLEERALLNITHQVREEDYDRVSHQYKAMGIQVHLAPFFADLPMRIAESHLVIGRAGASTVAELSALGRPSILVPLPGAVDQDQANNARTLEEAEAAIVVPQAQFRPDALGIYLRQALTNPDQLAHMAEEAKSQARLDAIERLCQIVQSVG